MNKISVVFLNVFLLIVFVAPAIVYGAGIIPCDTNCGFYDLIVLANNVVHFLIYNVVVPLITLRFMYIGAKYILEQDKESTHTEAREQLKFIGLGIFWILASFLLIKFILYQFINTEAGFTLFLLQ